MDRETEFVNEVVKQLTEKFWVKHHRSILYRSQANELIERFNKSLCDLLAKLVDESAIVTIYDCLWNTTLIACWLVSALKSVRLHDHAKMAIKRA